MISLCMIVRDESEVLARCLESAAGIADEIVIVDTGSTDETVRIARSFGARVDFFQWIDDFSAARNRSFELATCPYILWLDADDVILPADREKLLELKTKLDRDVYFLRYDRSHDELGNCLCSLYRERLVRNTPRIRWQFPVHESLTLDSGVTTEVVDAAITHRPTAQGLRRDAGRNIRILERALAEPAYATVPLLSFLLGVEYQAAGRALEALALYERSSALPGGWPDPVWGWQQLALCHFELSFRDAERAAAHRARARLAAQEGGSLDPRRAEPCFLLGQIAEAEGDLEEAVSWYERALRPVPEVEGPIAPGFYGLGPAIRLSALFRQLGDFARADHYNEMALRWSPRDPLLHLARRELRRLRS